MISGNPGQSRAISGNLEHEIRIAAQEEKLRLEREIEIDSERHFNSCSSRSSLSLPGSPSVAASAPTMPYPNLHLPPGSYHLEAEDVSMSPNQHSRGNVLSRTPLCLRIHSVSSHGTESSRE